jgi:putative transcriptional regulator
MVRTTAQGRLNAVRRHRVLADLTQARLATEVGVTRQTVVAIEAGDYAPSVYLALRIAQVLATTVEDLFADARAQAPSVTQRPQAPSGTERNGR